MAGYENARNRVAKIFHTDRSWLREFFAEFLGTAFLVALGDAAVAQVLVRARTVNPNNSREHIIANPDFLSVNFGFAFAIAFGVYIAGGISGGHINPAVSLAMAVFGRLPWIKLPIYWLAQLFGAFIGSVILYITYYDSFTLLDATSGGGRLGYSPGVFATYPAPHMNIFPSILDQVIGTAILLLVVFALTDSRNAGVPKYLTPLLVGLTVGLIGLSYGIQCGYAINPARDFGPRLFALIVWGSKVFQIGNARYDHYFLIPILGPFFGAVLGAFIYQALIGIHWPTVYEVTPPIGAAVTTSVTTTTVTVEPMSRVAPGAPVETEVRLTADAGKNGKDKL